MGIIISDERIVALVQKLAEQLDKTPEQIVAEAIEQFSPRSQGNGKAFWNAIRGIADSGDPNLAYHVKDIVRQEVDPIEGWSESGGSEDTDR